MIQNYNLMILVSYDNSLNDTKRGRDADAYYISHSEIDTVIGHSSGGAVALSLEKSI